MTSKLLVLFGLLIATSCVGQVAVTVGPSPAPVGAPIAISVANDTNALIMLANPCPFQVRNAGGTVIFAPFCIQIVVAVQPGNVFTTYWNQVDNNNVQVAPGTYTVDVILPGGMSSVSLTINASVEAGAVPLGPVRINRTRHLYLTSPQDPAFPYLVGASGPPVSGGIPTCGGVVPLENDLLLQLSLSPNPFFASFSGSLGNTGSSTAPTITVPNDPTLSGVTFTVAFVALDPSAPCVVRSISAPLLVLVL